MFKRVIRCRQLAELVAGYYRLGLVSDFPLSARHSALNLAQKRTEDLQVDRMKHINTISPLSDSQGLDPRLNCQALLTFSAPMSQDDLVERFVPSHLAILNIGAPEGVD